MISSLFVKQLFNMKHKSYNSTDMEQNIISQETLLYNIKNILIYDSKELVTRVFSEGKYHIYPKYWGRQI